MDGGRRGRRRDHPEGGGDLGRRGGEAEHPAVLAVPLAGAARVELVEGHPEVVRDLSLGARGGRCHAAQRINAGPPGGGGPRTRPAHVPVGQHVVVASAVHRVANAREGGLPPQFRREVCGATAAELGAVEGAEDVASVYGAPSALAFALADVGGQDEDDGEEDEEEAAENDEEEPAVDECAAVVAPDPRTHLLGEADDDGDGRAARRDAGVLGHNHDMSLAAVQEPENIRRC